MTNQPEFSFKVTVRKRYDLDEPTTEKRALAIVKWLLTHNTYLDVVHIESNNLTQQGDK